MVTPCQWWKVVIVDVEWVMLAYFIGNVATVLVGGMGKCLLWP